MADFLVSKHCAKWYVIFENFKIEIEVWTADMFVTKYSGHVSQVVIICCDRKWLVMIKITWWLILREHIISLLSDHLNCSVIAYLISFIVNSTYSLLSFLSWDPLDATPLFKWFFSFFKFLLQAEIPKMITSMHSSDLQEGDPISGLLLVLVGRHSTKGVLERVWIDFLLKISKGSVLGVNTSWLLAHR